MAEETVPVTPPAPATETTPAQPAAPATTLPNVVTLPREQFDSLLALQGRVAQLEAEERSRARAATDEQVRQATLAGQAETAVTAVRQQLTADIEIERRQREAVEARARRYARDGELSRDLAGRNLVPGAVDQLARLWGDEFVVEAQGESFAVRTKTFQSVGDFVNQQLARPEYAHFLRPQGQGGTGGVLPGTQTLPSQPAHPAAAPEPRNMGEAVILHMKAMSKAQGDPTANMSLPLGLKAVR